MQKAVKWKLFRTLISKLKKAISMGLSDCPVQERVRWFAV